jgi:hypothetical protein
MWTFDGEEWIEEGASPKENKRPETSRFEEFYPELQVLEIVPLPNVNYDVPPLPLP